MARSMTSSPGGTLWGRNERIFICLPGLLGASLEPEAGVAFSARSGDDFGVGSTVEMAKRAEVGLASGSGDVVVEGRLDAALAGADSNGTSDGDGVPTY